MAGPTWDQGIRAWRAILGSGMLIWGTVVVAQNNTAALPYVLAAGTGLLGLSFSIPWERDRKNDK